MEPKSVFDYWNQRASLGVRAGSDDYIGTEIEVAAIARHLRSGMKVVEFGCGNGITAIELVKKLDLHITCFDFAPAMIEEARRLAQKESVADRLTFSVANVSDEPPLPENVDTIYTQRMIINLPDWSSQASAIRYLARSVKVGGHYLMCENSTTGLARLNELRASAGLRKIDPPWHNVYLEDDSVAKLQISGVRLAGVEPFMATYYFLSRVINAWFAQREGNEPRYDAPVNQLALHIPSFGDCSQTKLWVFEKFE